MYPMYQHSTLVVPPDCLLRILGHALVVILARVAGQLVCDGVASPVVLGHLAVILVLLRLMSWDPFHVYGVWTPSYDSFLPELPQISVWSVDPSRWLTPRFLDPSETFDNRLIVDGNRDGSRSVRCMMAAVSSIRVELLMEELIVCYLLVSSYLASVSSFSMLCSGFVFMFLSMCDAISSI